jgi:hypothetical protein
MKVIMKFTFFWVVIHYKNNNISEKQAVCIWCISIKLHGVTYRKTATVGKWLAAGLMVGVRFPAQPGTFAFRERESKTAALQVFVLYSSP